MKKKQLQEPADFQPEKTPLKVSSRTNPLCYSVSLRPSSPSWEMGDQTMWGWVPTIAAICSRAYRSFVKNILQTNGVVTTKNTTTHAFALPRPAAKKKKERPMRGNSEPNLEAFIHQYQGCLWVRSKLASQIGSGRVTSPGPRHDA